MDEVDRRMTQKRIPVELACDSGVLLIGGFVSGAVIAKFFFNWLDQSGSLRQEQRLTI
jgi:hypothetical protein